MYYSLAMPRELPIFPLPLVLFPGASQALHIFEPRYRRMLADCLAGDGRFGIAYVSARTAHEAEAVPSTGDVGCVAVIRSTHRLPDGRSDILTEGERRFHLLECVRTIASTGWRASRNSMTIPKRRGRRPRSRPTCGTAFCA